MKKNAKTVSILLNVAIMFATVFAIISFTYSWYNNITSADIVSIDMSSVESSGILLSGNGLEWSPTLSTDGGSGSININDDVTINSISTSGTVEDGNIIFYYGEFSGTTFNTILLEDASLYYVFDVYVLNNDESAKMLTLANTSSVISVDNKDVELSVRVAFLNFGYANNPAGAINLDGTGVSSIDYIWEPNSTRRNDRIEVYHTNYIEEGKMTYNGVNMEASELDLSSNLVVDDIETPEQEVLEVTTYDPIFAGDKSDVTVLMGDVITKLRIFIWSEGQDIDSTNSISGGEASLNFSFNTYDVQLIGEEYVAVEKFNAPVIVNSIGATYTWEATTTNLSEQVYSENYLVKISKYIESELTAIRTISTSLTSINIDLLEDLGLGTYYIQVRVYSKIFGDSDYSNTLTFSVLEKPTNFLLLDPIISWSAVSDAESYTIKVYDVGTETTYTTTTTSLSLNLATTIFDGDIYIPTGRQYEVSIKANGNAGYVNSVYTEALDWLY